jgi:cyclic pyranopterin phosphate synthase
LSREELVTELQKRGELLPVASPGGFGPARYFRMAGHAGTLGFISSVTDHFCADCNRLRLTADGRLRSCLFSSDETEVREAVRAGDEQRTLELIHQTLEGKTFDKRKALGGSERGMSQIGG